MAILNTLAPIWYLTEPDLTASARKMSTSDVPKKPRIVHGYIEGKRGRKRRSHCRLNSHAKYKTAQPTRSRKPHLNGTLAWTGRGLAVGFFSRYGKYTRYMKYQSKQEVCEVSSLNE
jgi:hypothetical protein